MKRASAGRGPGGAGADRAGAAGRDRRRRPLRRRDADLARAARSCSSTALGQRDIEAGLPMTRDTLFRIASMTKPITSVAALMLMEEGKLRLDDPITKWMPEFADMRVLKNADGPVEDTYPAPRDITVEDLFTHRAGLAYGFTSIGPIAHAHQKALGDVLTSDMAPDAWLKALGGAAAQLSARRALPLQPRHRRAGLPGRPHRRARPFRDVPVRAHLRAARHGRHRLLHPAGEARPRRRGLPAEGRLQRAGGRAVRALRRAAELLRRRRRAGLDARRLPEVRPHAAGRTARSTACGS